MNLILKLKQVGNSKEIIVNNYCVINDEYNGKIFKTILVNDTIKVKTKDKITYICTQCGEEKIENFARKNKFIDETFICNVCERKKTSIKKYGVEFPAQNKEIYNKVKQTKKIKYNNENYNNIDKAKKTNIEKYGVESVLSSPEIIKKSKQTKIGKYGRSNIGQFGTVEHKKAIQEKYGVDNILQSPLIKNKIEQTNLERYGKKHINTFGSKLFQENMVKKYGVKNARHSKEINKKIQYTVFEKAYKNIQKNLSNIVMPLFSLKDYCGVERSNKYMWQCVACGNKFEDHLHSHIPRCLICNPHVAGFSNYEKEIFNFVKSLNIKNIIENDRSVLNGKELDIYLPDHNLAIEYDGLYWHSELQGKDKNYHLNKTLKCQKKGVNLIHIFEDEWLERQDIVKSIISSKLGFTQKIYARKCVVREVDNQKEFLEKNHLQGYIPAKVNIGLYYENELVSLLTFSKPRFNKNYDWEILRFANKLNTSIVGGFAKLLKYFKNNYEGSIITYSDRRLFDGDIYENNGFTRLKPSSPNYYYTEGKLKKYNRQHFQKHKLKDKLEVFDPNLTEWENMQLNGWDRIWDCGNNVFEDKVEKSWDK